MLIFQKTKDSFFNRLIMSIFIISVISCLIAFAYHPLGCLILVLAVALLAATGVWEYAQLALAKNTYPERLLMIIIASLEICAFYTFLIYPQWSTLALVVMVISFFSVFLFHFRNSKNALLDIAVEFFGICYLVVPLNFMLAILYQDLGSRDGRWWIFYLIAATKVTDMGGYLFGKILGRHSLAPHLSPSKTIEGSIGGFCFAIGLSVLFSLFASKINDHFTLSQAVCLGIMIGAVSQVGDLAESILKRDASVKDSNIIPGLGGILDMLDSLLFTAPIVYFFIKYAYS